MRLLLSLNRWARSACAMDRHASAHGPNSLLEKEAEVGDAAVKDQVEVVGSTGETDRGAAIIILLLQGRGLPTMLQTISLHRKKAAAAPHDRVTNAVCRKRNLEDAFALFGLDGNDEISSAKLMHLGGHDIVSGRTGREKNELKN